jgi:hypothetical protein
VMSVAPLGPPARTARKATTTGGMSDPETTLLQRPRSHVLVAAVAGLAAVAIVVALILWTRSASTGATASSDRSPTSAGPDEIERAARPPPSPNAVGALPDLVSITIAGPPENTEVYGPTGLLGVVPGIIQLPRRDGDVLLTFKAEDYVPATRAVKPTADAAITVELTPKSPRRIPPRRRDQGGGGPDGKSDKDGQGEGGEDERDKLESPF